MKDKLKKEHLIFGILILVSLIIIAIFVFKGSYALEGFGQINVSCDKTLAAGGEEIYCVLSGTVANGNEVAALSSQIELSSNLEFVSFDVDNSNYTEVDDQWLGDGEDGNIQLFTANNKTGTFAIGSLKVKVKEGTVNTSDSIRITNIYFTDVNFTEHSIESYNGEIRTPQITSEKYDFTKDYILSDTKKIDSILASITTEGCKVTIDNNGTDLTTGNITNGSKLEIIKDSEVLKTYDIIYINSEVYDLSHEYIVTSVADLNNISDDIEVINGNLSIKNNGLVLSYNSTDIKTYDIINLTSNNYLIDVKNDLVLFTGDFNTDNINITDNATMNSVSILLSPDYQIYIKYNGELVKELYALSLEPEDYQINLKDKYVYIGNEDISGDIKYDFVNLQNSIEVKDNQLILNFNDKEVLSLDIINTKSDKYTINTTNKFIYTKNITDISTIKQNISVTNANVTNDGNNLIIKHNDNVVEQFNIHNFTINNEDIIIINDSMYTRYCMSYNTLVDSITFNGLNYKIYTDNEELVESGQIYDNYKLKLYKDDILVDTYNIKMEYLTINNLTTTVGHTIYDLEVGETYKNLLKNFDTSGTITILDKDGNELSKDSKIRTSDIIRVQFINKTEKYHVSVLGDLNGSGDITISDVTKLYKYLKGRTELNAEELLAGELNLSDEITISDVTKLYKYLKGKIPVLKQWYRVRLNASVNPNYAWSYTLSNNNIIEVSETSEYIEGLNGSSYKVYFFKGINPGTVTVTLTNNSETIKYVLKVDSNLAVTLNSRS